MSQYHAPKRQEQAQESRKALMDAALSLFSANGYEASSVRNICSLAGVADSLLYHYFPGGKKELLQAIAQEEIEQVLQELNARNNTYDELPTEEALEALFLFIRDVVLRHAKVFRLLLRDRELLNASPLMALLSRRNYWLPQFLQKKAEKGEIALMNFEAASGSLNMLMLSHLIMELEDLPFSPLGDAANRRRMIAYQVGLWQKGE